MRLTLAHTLTQAEVRTRLKARAHEIAELIPGGLATATTSWPSDTHMDLTLAAMGKHITGHVEIGEHEVVFVVNLPTTLALFEPMIAGKLEEKGRKLLR